MTLYLPYVPYQSYSQEMRYDPELRLSALETRWVAQVLLAHVVLCCVMLCYDVLRNVIALLILLFWR
jgi:hypothetical protein